MKMRFQHWRAEHSGCRYEIEEDLPRVGAYLYVYNDGSGTPSQDYLQNSIQICKGQALDDFGVPLESWVFVGYIDSHTDIQFVDNYIS